MKGQAGISMRAVEAGLDVVPFYAVVEQSQSLGYEDINRCVLMCVPVTSFYSKVCC